jgi:hypothetical protein
VPCITYVFREVSLAKRVEKRPFVVLITRRSWGAVFGDNFFDLIPGGKRTISILKSAGGRTLTVRALNADPVNLAWNP